MHLRHVPATGPQDLEIQTVLSPPILHARLCGELDIATAGRLDAPELLMGDRADVTAVVLDLARLHFCDLTGLQALVRYRHAQTALHRLVQAQRVRPNVVRVMRAAGVTELFNL